MREELIKLGFSDHEATVYLALLDIGQTGAGEIIRRTGLHRNIVYDTLDKLISRRLAFKVINKKVAQFMIADPERIRNDQKVKLSLADHLVPELISRVKNKHEIVIYEGVEGFRNFSMDYMERMKDSETLYVLGSIGDRWYELMGKDVKRYFKLKEEKKIAWKMVTFEKNLELDKKNIQTYKNDEVRVMPKSFQAPASSCIWEDRISLQTFVEPFFVVVIKNKALAEAYLNYFNALWEMGKPL